MMRVFTFVLYTSACVCAVCVNVCVHVYVCVFVRYMCENKKDFSRNVRFARVCEIIVRRRNALAQDLLGRDMYVYATGQRLCGTCVCV